MTKHPLFLMTSFVFIAACSKSTDAPMNQPKSEITNKYMECVMNERERLYKANTNTKKTDNQIIGEVQNICNSRILKVKQ